MRKITATSAKILLFAIALFFFGPQFGSLDTDSDGIPDVPIMVMQVSNNQKAQAGRNDERGKIILTIASPFVQLTCNDLGFTRGRSANARSAGLNSVTPLLC